MLVIANKSNRRGKGSFHCSPGFFKVIHTPRMICRLSSSVKDKEFLVWNAAWFGSDLMSTLRLLLRRYGL